MTSWCLFSPCLSRTLHPLAIYTYIINSIAAPKIINGTRSCIPVWRSCASKMPLMLGGMARSLFMARRERRRPGWIILRASGVINIKLLRIKNETRWWEACAAPGHTIASHFAFNSMWAAARTHPTLMLRFGPCKMNNQCWFRRFVSLKSGWLDFLLLL